MSRIRVALACDAGPLRGVGHVMRCVALAEELTARGVDVVFVTDLTGVAWAADQVRSRGLPVRHHDDGAPDLAGSVLDTRPDAVVLDSYTAPATVSARIRAAGVPVLALVDGDTRGHTADLYLDQTLGAEEGPWPYAAPRLAGLRYVLLRDAVRGRRPARPRQDTAVARPRVLAHFGGTDPAGAAAVLAGVLAATGEPLHATVVAATPALAAVSATPLAPGQRLDVTGPLDDLPALAAVADLVVCATGTSVWEMMCVGAATAVTWVADNQLRGYDRTVATGAVAGLGAVGDIRAAPGPAVAELTALLRDPARRAALRATAWSLVDGRGRCLVADAVVALAQAQMRSQVNGVPRATSVRNTRP